MNIPDIIRNQRRFFRSGKTRPVDFRLSQLRLLKQIIKDNEQRILDALAKDLGKPAFEGYESEIGIVYEEINFALKNLRSWIKAEKVGTPITIFPSRSCILSEPRGTALIIGPWNFPFQLIIVPLIGSIAAGNTSIVKPSEVAAATSKILFDVISKAFSSEFVTALEGGADLASALLSEKFDIIFFTGGTAVGRMVAEHAARNLTPVILELGGKSPCVVDTGTNLKITARRIVWGKFLNAGQTCIAPDYLLVQRSEKEELLSKMKEQIRTFFGNDPSISPDYGRIINERHFDRLVSLLQGNIFAGGNHDRGLRYIAPTIIRDVKMQDEIMETEIFGPLLPVLDYDSIEDAIDMIGQHPDPLSLYLFTKRKKVEEKIMTEVSFGSGSINDCLVQFQNPNIPFGGVGFSGTGAYHGKYSFDAFSHYKSIVRATLSIDIPLRYPPYGKRINLLRKIIK